MKLFTTDYSFTVRDIKNKLNSLPSIICDYDFFFELATDIRSVVVLPVLPLPTDKIIDAYVIVVSVETSATGKYYRIIERGYVFFNY